MKRKPTKPISAATYEKALYAAGESLKAQDLQQFAQGVKSSYEETLEQALKRCYGDASKSLWSQARQAAIQAGLEMMERELSCGGIGSTWDLDYLLSQSRVSRIKPEDVQQATAKFYKDGLSPATINKRLNCLSKMGVSVEGLRVKDPKKSKWHLDETKLQEVVEWATLNCAHPTPFFLVWTTRTGLRIQESLRLTWTQHMLKERYLSKPAEWVAMRVPGTKTAASEATLALGPEMSKWLDRYEASYGTKPPNDSVFPISYERLLDDWNAIRKHFGFTEDTATLKALRRSAARYLHVDCNMPLHMVQQYLRHESMDTTLEYLRLTGGYGTEEMRRFLK